MSIHVPSTAELHQQLLDTSIAKLNGSRLIVQQFRAKVAALMPTDIQYHIEDPTIFDGVEGKGGFVQWEAPTLDARGGFFIPEAQFRNLLAAENVPS